MMHASRMLVSNNNLPPYAYRLRRAPFRGMLPTAATTTSSRNGRSVRAIADAKRIALADVNRGSIFF